MDPKISLKVVMVFTMIELNLGGILSSGKLEKCVRDSKEETDLDCSTKMIVTMTLENNKIHSTDTIDFAVACIESPNGNCPCPCDYRNDSSCHCRDLRQIISISVTKTPVYALYPLSQPRIFNGRPYEEYIPTGSGETGGSSCNDDWNSPSPTCGFAQAPDEEGQMQDIVDSQGFCCECPSWGSSSPIERGYTSCPFSTPWTNKGSAHCLRYDDWWWYRGYVIGQYQLDFEINIEINASITNESNGKLENHRLEHLYLSPSQTLMRSDDGLMLARLLGDFAAYRQIQNLDGHWLMIPWQPGLNPNEILSSNLNMWMILPPDKITLNGLECNKVGVGYSAFRFQTDRCQKPVGSCLKDQIYDLEYEDERRTETGLPPIYNIKRFGGGSDNVRQLMASGGDLSLRLPLTGLQTSLITLELNADEIQLVTNRAPGKIISSKVCRFNNVTCGSFQAITGRGYLHLQVQNSGELVAEFRASVVSCSEGILPNLEQYATILPMTLHNFIFELHSNSDQSGNRTCSIILTDSIGVIADHVEVHFLTEAVEYEEPPKQSELGDKPSKPGNPPSFEDCSSICPNIFNLICTIGNFCWKRSMYAVIAFIGVAISFTILAVCGKKLTKYLLYKKSTYTVHRVPDKIFNN